MLLRPRYFILLLQLTLVLVSLLDTRMEKKSQFPARINHKKSQSPFSSMLSWIATVHLGNRNHSPLPQWGCADHSYIASLDSNFHFSFRIFLKCMFTAEPCCGVSQALQCAFHHLGWHTQLHLLHQRLHVPERYSKPC